MNIDTLFAGNTKKGYTAPKFEPIKGLSLKESVQLMTRKLIDDFCEENNLIPSEFVLNILDLYQDYVHTKGEIESRGIIQLYTVYFVLHLISAYWSAIIGVKKDLLFNSNQIIDSMIISRGFVDDISTKRNNITTKLTEAYSSLESILLPNGKSNITTGIKYFLFRHPVSVNWKYYDTILYHSLILLLVLFNMIYTLKSTKKFDEARQKKLQLYIYDKKQHNKINKKVFPQLFLLHAFMLQHSSRKPYKKTINVEKSMEAEEAKYKNSNNSKSKEVKEEDKQKKYNHIENAVRGVNHSEPDEQNVRTMGIYSILDILFQLMYYHPFPFDASQLVSKTKKEQKNHPVNMANQQRAEFLKSKMSNKGSQDYFSSFDKEQFEIMGEIGNYLELMYGMGKKGIKGMQEKQCYINREGQKRCKMYSFAEKATLKALRFSGAKGLHGKASRIFEDRNRGHSAYWKTQKRNNMTSRGRNMVNNMSRRGRNSYNRYRNSYNNRNSRYRNNKNSYPYPKDGYLADAESKA